MIQIEVNQLMQEQLGDLLEPVALCDSTGKILGRVLSKKDYEELFADSLKLPSENESLPKND